MCQRSGNWWIFCNILKKFQLLWYSQFGSLNFSVKVPNLTELFIRHWQNTDQSSLRNSKLNPFNMHVHVFLWCAMPDIHRKLHHRKPVFLKRLSELSCILSLLFSSDRQIKKHKKPHDMICIYTIFWHYLTFSSVRWIILIQYQRSRRTDVTISPESLSIFISPLLFTPTHMRTCAGLRPL